MVLSWRRIEAEAGAWPGWRRSGLRDGLVDELVGLAVHYVVTARPVHEAV